ncbi:MAG: PRC-barrel domain containing protein, partial [Desulfobacterales bacterium]|nr:PRC-barrel domain containing protein [Desulfobacterales bacterium]
MDYPLNADVHCTDGRYGRSTYIILNPTAEKVTHVVVKDRKAPHSERLLPARWIKETTSELILVNGTKEEVRTLNLFDQT